METTMTPVEYKKILEYAEKISTSKDLSVLKCARTEITHNNCSDAEKNNNVRYKAVGFQTSISPNKRVQSYPAKINVLPLSEHKSISPWIDRERKWFTKQLTLRKVKKTNTCAAQRDLDESSKLQYFCETGISLNKCKKSDKRSEVSSTPLFLHLMNNNKNVVTVCLEQQCTSNELQTSSEYPVNCLCDFKQYVDYMLHASCVKENNSKRLKHDVSERHKSQQNIEHQKECRKPPKVLPHIVKPAHPYLRLKHNNFADKKLKNRRHVAQIHKKKSTRNGIDCNNNYVEYCKAKADELRQLQNHLGTRYCNQNSNNIHHFSCNRYQSRQKRFKVNAAAKRPTYSTSNLLGMEIKMPKKSPFFPICPAIFCLKSVKDRYEYLGITWDTQSAPLQEFTLLNNGDHPCFALQRVYALQGRACITYRVLERFAPSLFGFQPYVNFQKVESFLQQRREWHMQTRRALFLDNLCKRLTGSYTKPSLLAWKRKVEQFRACERNSAAILIQKYVRGWTSRRFCLKVLKERSATRIETCIRGFQACKHTRMKRLLYQQHRCAVLIQRFARKQLLVCKKVKNALLRRYQSDSAWMIQKAWKKSHQKSADRFFLIKKRRENNAIVLQCCIRVHLAWKKFSFLQTRKAAIRIQTRWRTHHTRVAYQLQRQKQKLLLENEHKAARIIQHALRNNHTRQLQRAQEHKDKLTEMEHAALKVQARWRAHQARISYIVRKHAQEKEWENQNRAASRIICFFQFVVKRSIENVVKREKSAVRIQKYWRARKSLQQRKAQQLCLEQTNAALKIQTQFRGKMAFTVLQKKQRQKLLKENELREHLVISLQSRWRCKQAQRIYINKLSLLRAREQLEHKAAVQLQKVYRGQRGRRKMQSQKRLCTYPLCDECAQAVCAWYCLECHAKMCDFCSSCLHGKGCLFESHTVFTIQWGPKEVRAAQLMQQAYRSYRARCVLAAKKHAHTVTLSLMHLAEKEKHACVLLQQEWRAYLTRKRYQRQMMLAIRIQSFLRGYWVRRDLFRLNWASLRIQAQYRRHRAFVQSNHLRDQQKRDQMLALVVVEEKKRTATVKIQACIRMYEKKRYVFFLRLALQRMRLSQKEQMTRALEPNFLWSVHQYREKVNSVITTYYFNQLTWEIVYGNKAPLGFQQERQLWEKKQKEKIRQEAQRATQHAAIKLQSLFRGHQTRTIQVYNRKQQIHDENVAREKQQQEWEIIATRAAIRIQCLWRTRHARYVAKQRLKERAQFQLWQQTTHHAALKMQNTWRTYRAKCFVHERRKTERAAVRIQCYWRAKQGRSYARMLLHRAQTTIADEKANQGWMTYYDTDAQCEYYYNQKTQEVTWNLPLELGGTWSSSTTSTMGVNGELYNSNGAIPPLQIGKWMILKDVQHEQEEDNSILAVQETHQPLPRTYFYDTETEHVTWRLPDELQGVYERDNPAEAWTVSQDPNMGREVYYNLDTGQQLWYRPKELGGGCKEGDEWVANVHLVSGVPFYTNVITGDAVWERPAVLGCEWLEKIEDDVEKQQNKGRVVYWENKVTGRRVFERPWEHLTPEEKEEQTQQAKIKATQPVWYEQWDETTQKPYFVLYPAETTEDDGGSAAATNAPLQVTWEKPLELMSEEEKRQRECLLWEEYYSKPDKASYYVHKETSETVWRKPDCFRI